MRRNGRYQTSLLCWAVVFALLASVGEAQHITGTILGTVTDSSGAVLPAATVTVTNEDTNLQYKAAFEATGEYQALNLPPGTYTITTEFAGFKRNTVKGVRLLANRTVRVDVVLEPGTVVETIEVRASAPVVNSENATIGNVMENKIITTLPLNGRRIDQLIVLAAGNASGGTNNPRIGGSSYWGGTQFTVDGVNYNDSGNGGAVYMTGGRGLSGFPSIDAISEFKVDSNNQKAEYESASSVTIVTKTGANQFHGSAFEFNRNKAYAAQNAMVPATQPKPPFNRNEFGVAVGGPVRKNRTLFFGSYEGLRERSPRTNQLSVATAAMRDGDFTGLPTILDPFTGQPFANNRVPTQRIDPRSKTLIGYVPLPNLPGIGPAGTLNNYIVNLSSIGDVNRHGIRLDHRFSDRDSVWGSYQYSNNYPNFIRGNYPEGYGHTTSAARDRSLNLTHQRSFSPRTLNEFRFGWLDHGWRQEAMNYDFDPRTLFPGLYPLPAGVGGLPRIDISSHVGIGDRGRSLQRPKQWTTQFIENFTHVRGRHSLKAGFDIDHFSAYTPPSVFGRDEGEANDAGLGRFTFNGRFTNNNPSGAAQPAHAFADFLLGYPNVTYRSTPGGDVTMYTTRYSGYVQDDWQVSPRLTLTFGVRYMAQAAWKEKNGNQANFDFTSGKLVVPGNQMPPKAQARVVSAYPIVTATQAGLPADLIETDKTNFAPRFGFAFRPFGGNKTVIRGGAGMFYNFLPVFIGFNQLGNSNAPFLLAETFESDPGRLPSLTLANPFPGSGAISPNPSITAVDRNIKNSVSQQWNLTVERELAGNLGFRVSYVGNKTSHLPYYNRQANIAERQTPGAIQPLRPYQPWADINLLASAGDSTIHQLQVEAIQRYSRGLTLQAEYSWNRSLDNTPIVGGPQNPYNNSVERGNSDSIRRHILAFAADYELPFGPGKFANVTGPLGKIAGGWQVGSITFLRTGNPFSVGFSPTQPGWQGGRANLIADPTLSRSERSRGQWFNTAAFAVPAPFTYGNSARNLLFGPGSIDVDLSLLKDTRLTERFRLQFRAEFFNFANHANLGGPGTNMSVPATFGKITGWSGSRQIQFGAKLLF